jgi:hypothetical protein
MSNKPKLLSGRIPVKDSANVAADRYQFLELSSAEPNLGLASNGDILIYNTANPGQRGWIGQTNTDAYKLAQSAFNEANNRVSKSGDTMTGDLNIDSANVHANVVIVNNTLYSGLATQAATPLPNVIAQFTGNTNSYIQVNAQNIDPYGSADYVVTADNGTDLTFYIDMGINGSNSYNPDDASAISPLDGYLYVKGSDIGQEHGNLIIGTSTSNTGGLETKIVSGGLNEENVVARFNSEGLNVIGSINATGNITSNNIVRIDETAQSAYTQANTGTLIAQSAYDYANTLPVTIVNDSTSNNIVYLNFTQNTSGQLTTIGTSSANLSFNPSSGTLSVNNINIGTQGSFITNRFEANTAVVMDTLSADNVRSAFYQIQLEYNGISFHALNMTVMNFGGQAKLVTYGDVYSVIPLGTFSTEIVSGGNLNVNFTPLHPNTYLTFIRTTLVPYGASVPTGGFGFVTEPVEAIIDNGYVLESVTNTEDYGNLS